MKFNDRRVLFNSDSGEWGTPQWLYEELNKEFNFTLDVCATENNFKCINYFSPKQDGLKQKWVGRIFCNPPYIKRQAKFWAKKATEAILENDVEIIVMLLPARTCTKFFHDYIYNKSNVEIRFLKGRLQFEGAKYKAPFPSMVIIFRKSNNVSE